ncbi:prolipoprotein diacylglyceryl transferase [Collinsella sp. zg1085]|uniref:prolipoprotein diacylglyceryl transferase n=1 Tax=Collinsella sp. zg1085 TaxID=2844380 RepID=UPI001C0CEF29|nr:prolipoprotein diacylglyceryl transferase [Collinsella sp. zg1085]QWT17861.1 prolipoprotein diacylglyceryl transferase [Collinsella sp. zg1085]
MLNDLYHALDPVAFSAGPITIYWYGIAYMVGAIITGVVMYRTQKRWKLDIAVDDIWVVITCVVIGLIVGARIFYLVFYGRGLEFYLQNPFEIIALQHGGMSFHGGLVGGTIGGFLATRWVGLAPGTIADLVACGVPLALALGRFANFVNGELWGKPTDLPWGVVFGGDAGMMPRHPSQLYEGALEGLVLFAVLYVLSRKRPLLPQGSFMGIFILGYGIARILVEFVRVPDAQLGYLVGDIVTMGQILSIPLLIIGVGLIIIAQRAKLPQQGHVGEV